MDNAAQRAGDIFATIVFLVIPVVDAAESLGITAKIASAFRVVSIASEAGEEALVLRASDESGKALVEIWAKGDDGSARAMTKAEAETLEADLASEGELLADTRPTPYSFCPLPLSLQL